MSILVGLGVLLTLFVDRLFSLFAIEEEELLEFDLSNFSSNSSSTSISLLGSEGVLPIIEIVCNCLASCSSAESAFLCSFLDETRSTYGRRFVILIFFS